MSQPSPGAVLRGAVDLSSLRNRPAPDAATTASEAAAPAADLVIDATDQTFGEVLELSRTVPVVVDLWATWCGPCAQLGPILEKVVREQAGKMLLARVDVDANPQLAAGFRAQSIPMVVALVAGQPVPLFTGAVPEAQVREVFAQLLALAAQHGVTGTLAVGDGADAAAEPEEDPVPPLHAQAFDAISAGDYDGAIAAYEAALAENPRDVDAQAGLGQVRLLQRVAGVDLQQARDAASDGADVDAQLVVADLDVSGGHVDDAFARLLDVFAVGDVDVRAVVRERLLELFGIVGETDPRVGQARRALTSLMF